jgi:hypothetical protein
MAVRLTFLAIVTFWLTMNVWLWRVEFGTHGGATPVPVVLVCHKILTAPDASSLSVYQNGDRMGYCEFSTGVEQEMAKVEGDRPPPESIARRLNYQIHLAGNVALGDFTNRLKFDGRLVFSSAHAWQEMNLRISLRQNAVEIHSLATNQSVQFKWTNDAGVFERQLTFADLQNPATLVRTFFGNFTDQVPGLADLPLPDQVAGNQPLVWTACRTRVKIAREAVPIYRLETSILGRPVTIDVSTLGEILRVQLPGDYCARLDEWTAHD